MDFSGAGDYILDRLRRELHTDLRYHSYEHTLKVHRAVAELNRLEMPDETMRILLETAALYHDAGMIIKYHDHEETSVQIAEEILPRFGYSPEEIEVVARLIRRTKLPQQPTDLAEQIICDADLDSLGRPDFFIESFRLRLEWKLLNISNMNLSEWLKFQEKFLEEHDFFTKSAKDLRQRQKEMNLAELREINHQ